MKRKNFSIRFFLFLRLQKYSFDFTFSTDTESSGLAVLLLLDVPLASESGRWTVALRRSKFLLRLVERAQHRHLLEDVEYARASMGCAVSVVDTMFYPLPQYPGFRSGCYNSARINDHAHTLARKIPAQIATISNRATVYASPMAYAGLSCFRFPSLLLVTLVE